MALSMYPKIYRRQLVNSLHIAIATDYLDAFGNMELEVRLFATLKDRVGRDRIRGFCSGTGNCSFVASSYGRILPCLRTCTAHYLSGGE